MSALGSSVAMTAVSDMMERAREACREGWLAMGRWELICGWLRRLAEFLAE
jgi:hypothetical protein